MNGIEYAYGNENAEGDQSSKNVTFKVENDLFTVSFRLITITISRGRAMFLHLSAVVCGLDSING